MNYPVELRERYNEVMYEERDIIEKFLKDHHDIRYGRQRGTWHFEPAINMLSLYGNFEHVTDIMLDNHRLVIFILDDAREYECFDFAYGELSKVIEALRDANDILIENAKSDIAEMCKDNVINLEENPFKSFINGLGISIYRVNYEDGHIKAYTYTGKDVMDETNTGLVLGLRNHINIEVLHRSNEYKELMELLSLEENMRFECQNYGDATFVIDGTDVTFDVSSVRRNDNGCLVIYGNDIDANVCDNIELTEKDIKHEYLVGIINEMKRSKYCDIMDTYNSHNPELVRKINDAWKSVKYHNMFGDILFALGCRDKQEIMDKFDVVIYSNETAMDNAHEIMEGVCDDLDLECILKFIRYE